MAIQQIQPQQNFPISRLLPDLGDGVTYYVQAVVRNATTNATIATVPLPIQGSRIYGATWLAAADTSGLGLYITITTTAYYDSSYTSKAIEYGEESDTYIIYNQYNQLQFLASQLSALIGSESHVDYKKIKAIMTEVMIKFVKAIEFPAQKEYEPEFKKIAEALKLGLGSIKFPEIPKYEQISLAPILEAVKSLEAGMVGQFQGLPKPKEVDLGPIMAEFKKVDLEASLKPFKDIIEILNKLKDMNERIADTMPEVGKYFDDISGKLEEVLHPKQPEPVPAQALKLMRSGDTRL